MTLPPLPLMLKSMIPDDRADILQWGAAVRLAALEECAIVCDKIDRTAANLDGGRGSAIECAAAIRALRDA